MWKVHVIHNWLKENVQVRWRKPQQILCPVTVGAGHPALHKVCFNNSCWKKVEPAFPLAISLLVDGVYTATFCSHHSFCNLTAAATMTVQPTNLPGMIYYECRICTEVIFGNWLGSDFITPHKDTPSSTQEGLGSDNNDLSLRERSRQVDVEVEAQLLKCYVNNNTSSKP